MSLPHLVPFVCTKLVHRCLHQGRLWLAVAVATLWLLRVGGAADETIPTSTVLDVTALCPGRVRTRRATRLRLVSVFRQGWVVLLVVLLPQEPLPEGRLVPEPWPAVPLWEEATCEPQRALLEAAGDVARAPEMGSEIKTMYINALEKTSPLKLLRAPRAR